MQHYTVIHRHAKIKYQGDPFHFRLEGEGGVVYRANGVINANDQLPGGDGGTRTKTKVIPY